jgi:hypothetical protein
LNGDSYFSNKVLEKKINAIFECLPVGLSWNIVPWSMTMLHDPAVIQAHMVAWLMITLHDLAGIQANW